MDIVADTSVLIAVIADEPERPALIAATRGASLVAPSSVHWEIGNAFAAMLRRGRVEIDQVRAAIGLYDDIPIRFMDVELDEAMTIAAEQGVYAYDAYLLRCAQRFRLPLLTLDRRLMAIAERLGIATIELEANE